MQRTYKSYAALARHPELTQRFNANGKNGSQLNSANVADNQTPKAKHVLMLAHLLAVNSFHPTKDSKKQLTINIV